MNFSSFRSLAFTINDSTLTPFIGSLHTKSLDDQLSLDLDDVGAIYTSMKVLVSCENCNCAAEILSASYERPCPKVFIWLQGFQM